MPDVAPRYEVIPYQPELKPGLLRLGRHLWGDNDSLNQAYFEWKYEANPYLRPPLIFLAMFQGEPVGMRGLMGSRWEAAGLEAPQLLGCAGDLVVAPPHRRQGLALAIMRAAHQHAVRKGIPYLLSTSGTAAARRLLLRSHGRTFGPYLHLVRPRQGNPAETRQSFGLLDQEGPSSKESPGEFSVTPTPHPETMADLVSRSGDDGRIRVVRDTRYLQWRFLNPRSSYRFCYLHRGRLRAYLVLQTRLGPGSGLIRVMDWEGESSEYRRKLLTHTFAMISDRTEIRRSVLPPSDRAALESIGFAEVPPGPDAMELLVDSLTTGSQEPPWRLGKRDMLDREQWDYRAVYSDGG